MEQLAQPYFTISKDFSPDEETVEIEVYRGDQEGMVFYERTPGYPEFLEQADKEEFPPEGDEEIETEDVRFDVEGELADGWFRSLGEIASDYELSDPIGYNSNTYRLEMFSQIGEHGEICRWDENEVPGLVEQVFEELERKALAEMD